MNGAGFGGVVAGDKYNRLEAVRFVDKTKYHSSRWLWLCECGEQAIVLADSVKSGHTKSCGCHYRESRSTISLKHGCVNIPGYNSWRGMISRCYREKDASYHEYGKRGIKVCDRWLETPENFFADMGERPSPDHTIDRIDNDGDYEPGNCKWSTSEEQCNNRRNNVHVEFHNQRLTITECAKKIGCDSSTFRRWLSKDLTPEEIEAIVIGTFRKGIRFYQVCDILTIVTTPDTNLELMFSNMFYIVVSSKHLNVNNKLIKVVYGYVRAINKTEGV